MSLLNFEIKYPLDETGSAPENLIIAEKFTLEERDSKYIILKGGPFYADSLSIKHVLTGKTLIPSIDYHCDFLYKAATDFTGKSVYVLVHIKNIEMLRDFEATYQVVGGQFSTNVPTLEAAINQLLKDRRVTYFDDVLNTPDLWEPSHHPHDARDLIGMSEAVSAIKELNATLEGERDTQYLELLSELKTKANNSGPVKFGVENSLVSIKKHTGQIRLQLPRSVLNDITDVDSSIYSRFTLDVIVYNSKSLTEYKISGSETDGAVSQVLAGWVGSDSNSVLPTNISIVDDLHNCLVLGDASTEWRDTTVVLRSITVDTRMASSWLTGYLWEVGFVGDVYPTIKPEPYGMTSHYHSALSIIDGILNSNRLPDATAGIKGAVVVTNNTDSTSESEVPSSQALNYVKCIALAKWTKVTANIDRPGVVALSNVWNGSSEIKAVTERGLKLGLDTKSDKTHKHDAGDIISGTMATARLPKAKDDSSGPSEIGIVGLNSDIDSDSITEASTPKALSDGLGTRAKLQHDHDASEIVSGVMAIDRLPISEVGKYGLVKLTDSYSLDSEVYTPNSAALFNGLATKSGKTHKHDASHIVSGVISDSRLPKASYTNPGITYLTDDLTGNSKIKAITQYGISKYAIDVIDPSLLTLENEINRVKNEILLGWVFDKIEYSDVQIIKIGEWIPAESGTYTDTDLEQTQTIEETSDITITEKHVATGATRTKSVADSPLSRILERTIKGTKPITTYGPWSTAWTTWTPSESLTYTDATVTQWRYKYRDVFVKGVKNDIKGSTAESRVLIGTKPIVTYGAYTGTFSGWTPALSTKFTDEDVDQSRYDSRKKYIKGVEDTDLDYKYEYRTKAGTKVRITYEAWTWSGESVYPDYKKHYWTDVLYNKKRKRTRIVNSDGVYLRTDSEWVDSVGYGHEPAYWEGTETVSFKDYNENEYYYNRFSGIDQGASHNLWDTITILTSYYHEDALSIDKTYNY